MSKHLDRDFEQEKGINAKDFLIGALVGGIVGALTALLLSPKSGKEIRGDLNMQARAIKEKSSRLAESAKTKGAEFVEAAKEKSATIGQAISKQSSQVINKVKGIKSKKEFEDAGHEESGRYISINEDIQRKLEETKKAFDETESMINRKEVE